MSALSAFEVLMVISNVDIVLPDSIFHGSVRIENGKISKISENARNECSIYGSGSYLFAGIVDVHTHGAGGYDFMDGDLLSFENAAISLLNHGTTAFLATSLTSKDEELDLFIDNAKRAKRGAKLLGLHLEGPYINAKEKGAQDERYIRNPNLKEIERTIEKGEGLIKRVSLAPELDGAIEVIDYLAKNNIRVSAAHTAATYDDISKAYDHGLSLLTHFYSGMSSITRKGGFRILGAVESGYLIDDLYVEIISDNMHLPPSLLDFIFRFKRHDRIISCSDSMRAAGLGDGPSILGPKHNGLDVIVEGGIAKLYDRTAFAGSVATGEVILKTIASKLGPVEASRIISLYPAKTVGFDKVLGSIEIGKSADLIITDKEFNIKKVILNGEVVNEHNN